MIIFAKFRKFFQHESAIEDSTKSINNSKLENSSLKSTNEGEIGLRNKSKCEKVILNKFSNHENSKGKSQKLRSTKNKNKRKLSFISSNFKIYCNDTSESSFSGEFIEGDSDKLFQQSHLENSNFKSQLINIAKSDSAERLSRSSKKDVKSNIGNLLPSNFKEIGSLKKKSIDLKKVEEKDSTNKKLKDSNESTSETNEDKVRKPKSNHKKSNSKRTGKKPKHKSKENNAKRNGKKTDVEIKNKSISEDLTPEESLNQTETETNKKDKRPNRKHNGKQGVQNKKKKRKKRGTESNSSTNETSTDNISLNTNETKHQISAFKDLDEINSIGSAELSGSATEELSLGYKPPIEISKTQDVSDVSSVIKESTVNSKTDSDEMNNEKLMKLIESSTDSSSKEISEIKFPSISKEISENKVPSISKQTNDKSQASDSSINSEQIDINQKKEPKINIITPHESERRNKKVKKTPGKKSKTNKDKSQESKNKNKEVPIKDEIKTDKEKKSKKDGLKKDSDKKPKSKGDKNPKKHATKNEKPVDKNKKNKNVKKVDDSDVDSQLSIESGNEPLDAENVKKSKETKNTVDKSKKTKKKSKKPKDDDVVDSTADNILNQQKISDSNKKNDLEKNNIIDDKKNIDYTKSKIKKESSIDRKKETNITGDTVPPFENEKTQDKLKYKNTGTDVQIFFENKGTQFGKISFTIDPVEVHFTQKDNGVDSSKESPSISKLKSTNKDIVLDNIPKNRSEEEVDGKDSKKNVSYDDDLKYLFSTNMQDLRNINLGSHCRICELIFDSCCNCGCLMDKNRIPVYSTVDCNYDTKKHNCNSLKKSRSVTICKPKKSCECNYPTRCSSCSDSLTLSYNCVFGDSFYDKGCPQKVLCISR